ncbi:MAG: HlyD family efflux transporter periplasmic adaptor subunit [Deltaproteobacteria bacterium]|nr:HlyD family efflux transporter periplasmic adaptor subunit [Deltaproteobacteria bacterium]
MASTLKRKALFLIPLLLIMVAVSVLAVKRVQQRAQEKSTHKRMTPVPLAVRCIRTVRGPIHALVFGEGTARAVRREFLTFEHPGKVTYVKVKKDGQPLCEGDRVKGPEKGHQLGELLASVDKRQHVEQLKVAGSSLIESRQQVEVARAQIAQAEAQQKLAVEDYRRKQTLYKVKAISRHELDVARTNLKTADTAVQSARARLESALSGVAAAEARIKQARLPMERSSIYAPFDGVLTYVNIKKGDYFAANLVDVSSEEALLRTIPMVIIDPDQFEVTLELPYFEGVLVHPGQPALIMIAANMAPSVSDLMTDGALPKGVVRGTVFSVNPAVSPGGRSIQVKVRTAKGAQGIRDGMFVTCWIVVDEKTDAIVVPFDVFIYRQNKPYVFRVDQAGNRVEQIEIVEGISGLSTQEILQGVGEGELLVTDGRHRLSNGAPVEVIDIAGEKAN